MTSFLCQTVKRAMIGARFQFLCVMFRVAITVVRAYLNTLRHEGSARVANVASTSLMISSYVRVTISVFRS